MVDMSMLAPQGGAPGGAPGGMPPGGAPGGAPQGAPQGPPGQGQGMNPGGMEGFKGAIQFLLQQGLSPEEILQACLKIAGDLGMNIPEEQLRQMIEQVSAGAGAAGPGAAGPSAGAPTGAPPMAPPSGAPMQGMGA